MVHIKINALTYSFVKVTSKSDGYDAKQTVRSVIKTIGNAEKHNEAQIETFKAYINDQ